MTNDTRPTVLDLFSGIGGFSLAFDAAGFRTIGFSEIDPYASAVLRKHWPSVPNFGDIRNVKRELTGPVDVITAGFPCQPFSVAGKKRGAGDDRFLWPELLRVCGDIRPKFMLFENVVGLLSNDQGRTFGRILGEVVSLGYDCLWNCVPASAVGAPHQRDRMWIVAHSNERKRSPGLACEPIRRRESRSRAPEVSRSYSNANSSRQLQPQGSLENIRGWDLHLRSAESQWRDSWSNCLVSFCGMDDGVSRRLDSSRPCGNSIVPQAALIYAQALHKALTS